ncbi:Mitochondrial metal transporter 2 [Ceratocystis fimbriata CBS 114723]|uniref:Mitochondrial metal transporter 2 n=1 Tax=Ceratocystis fimbriata CBS 114723 TaxID=1035309 RepID=A0A2C5X4J3_9PEZI|nr:Mitochondrial metal transporter 2 [Ceratocystis fimbriata CBS 114723]
MSAIQTRTHGGHHHHHHHHHHDNIYLTSKDKNDAGVRITRIGLLSNLGMAIAKGIGGYAFNSHAMVADAYHSVTDLASDILTLATVSWSLKEPTHDYPTGFGKVESLGSLGVSGMLLTGGLLMCWSSFVALLEQIGLDPAALGGILAHAHDHGHSHSHSHGNGGPSLHAAWLAAGTIAIKEWLYHKTMAVARARKSSVLASNAIHHRVDSLTGVVTLAVILASNWFTNAEWLDSVGGLLISILVIKAGAENTIAAVSELADRAIDSDTASSVRKYSLRVLQDLEPGHGLEIREVGGVKSGQNYLIDIEVAVPLSWTIEKMRTIEDAVRFQIGSRVRGAKRVRVRFVPIEGVEQKSFDEFVPGDVTPRESTPEPEEHDHDHDHKHSNGKSGKE